MLFEFNLGSGPKLKFDGENFNFGPGPRLNSADVEGDPAALLLGAHALPSFILPFFHFSALPLAGIFQICDRNGKPCHNCRKTPGKANLFSVILHTFFRQFNRNRGEALAGFTLFLYICSRIATDTF